MTTLQESTNGHRVSPLPCPFPDSPEETQSKDSPNNNSQFAQHGSGVVERQKDLAANVYPQDELRGGKDITSLLAHEKVTEAFPANAYHVPPARFTPRAYPYRRDDMLNLPPETEPLPQRCQFMFSDGRQCTMGRSDIHPSLCPYHSEREEQLFGTPGSGRGAVVGGSFDLAELYSASADLTTAAGVNRALGLVFRLLAQRRISRQEAATFAKLAHLLLQSISAARTESTDYPASPPRKGYPQDALFADNQVVPSSGESHGHQELSPVKKVHHERGAQFAPRTELRGIPPEPPADREMSPASLPPRDALPTPQHKNGSSAHQRAPFSVNSSEPPKPPAAPSEPLTQGTAAKSSLKINTSAHSIRNSREINTSEIAGLKIAQNQHLQKNGGDNGISESSSIKLGRTGSEGAERVPDHHENSRKT